MCVVWDAHLRDAWKPAIIAQLIGPAGSTIKRLQAETGARIDVDSQHTPCEVTISGASPAIVEAARRAVEAIVSPTSVHIRCDSSSVGQVIGPKGATIKRLQAETGARIDVDSHYAPSLSEQAWDFLMVIFLLFCAIVTPFEIAFVALTWKTAGELAEQQAAGEPVAGVVMGTPAVTVVTGTPQV